MISTLRHQEIFNPRDNNTRVTVIGAGAVGSRVVASLIELGITNIHVYDPDYVEAHNLANQLYAYEDIGRSKVAALLNWVLAKLGFYPTEFVIHAREVTAETPIMGTVFLLVDSLEVRKQLVSSFHGNTSIARVIDVRMAAAHGSVFCFSPHTQLQEYLGTLGSDEDAEVSACGSPYSVGPTANILANMAVWQYINVKTNPAAVEERINIFLRPLITITSLL